MVRLLRQLVERADALLKLGRGRLDRRRRWWVSQTGGEQVKEGACFHGVGGSEGPRRRPRERGRRAVRWWGILWVVAVMASWST